MSSIFLLYTYLIVSNFFPINIILTRSIHRGNKIKILEKYEKQDLINISKI